MEFLQQGDVLIKPCAVPPEAKETKDPVLMHGEATGHAHRLHGDGFQVFEHPKTNRKHLRIVKSGVMLRHEEHKAFEVPPGEYEVTGVREYDHFDEEARQVVD